MERVCPSEVPLGYTFGDVKGLMSLTHRYDTGMDPPQLNKYHTANPANKFFNETRKRPKQNFHSHRGMERKHIDIIIRINMNEKQSSLIHSINQAT